MADARVRRGGDLVDFVVDDGVDYEGVDFEEGMEAVAGFGWGGGGGGHGFLL